MTALGQQAVQLQEKYPENEELIAAKQDEIVAAWGNLKDKVTVTRSYAADIQESHKME